MGDEYRVDGIELPDMPDEPGSDDRLGATARTKVAAAAEKRNERDDDEPTP